MVTELLEQAKQRKAKAEAELDAARQQADQLAKEVSDLNTFLSVAEVLKTKAEKNGRPVPVRMKTLRAENAKLSVQKGSWAGLAARLLLDKGPLSLKDIVAELAVHAAGRPYEKLKANINSALWRREDMFVLKNGLYDLLAKEVEFV